MTVMAFDTERRTNAELILHCVDLGYLSDTDFVLDPTYGLGNWWKLWAPHNGRLMRHDTDPSKAPDGPMDFTALTYSDRTFDAVTYDPPYKLNGTPTAAVDSPYGVHIAARWQDRMKLMVDGLHECVRVAKVGGYVLAKCQDQVVSGKVVWQTQELAREGVEAGCRLVDMLHVSSYRPQPPGRRQVHAARNHSTLLVMKRLP